MVLLGDFELEVYICYAHVLYTVKVAVEVSRRRLMKTYTWVIVRTSVTPSFRVRVWFRAILLCLILKKGFSSSIYS